jgi:hypothetical protein
MIYVITENNIGNDQSLFYKEKERKEEERINKIDY